MKIICQEELQIEVYAFFSLGQIQSLKIKILPQKLKYYFLCWVTFILIVPPHQSIDCAL
jgi:hypothetical protein